MTTKGKDLSYDVNRAVNLLRRSPELAQAAWDGGWFMGLFEDCATLKALPDPIHIVASIPGWVADRRNIKEAIASKGRFHGVCLGMWANYTYQAVRAGIQVREDAA